MGARGRRDQRRRNVVAAFCRAHYGGVLIAAGRWDEAEAQLVESTRHFDRGMPERRAEALIRLADLRIKQGRLEEAGVLLDGHGQHPDAVRTLAALYHAPESDGARPGSSRAEYRSRGRRSSDGRRLDDARPTPGPARDVYLATGDVDAAAETADRLGCITDGQRGPYLKAAAALARGRVSVAGGRGDARVHLHQAVEGFARGRLPLELARTRLEMAYALAERSPEVAIAEAKAALADFERLQATRYADAAGALLRSLGAPYGPGRRVRGR